MEKFTGLSNYVIGLLTVSAVVSCVYSAVVIGYAVGTIAERCFGW